MNRILKFLLIGALNAYAQPPSYETASIKPSAPDAPSHMTTNPGGIDWGNISLLILVRLAYGLKDYSMVAPGWLADTHFDVVARIPSGVHLDQNAPMLQSLLAERFKLAVHHEQKVMSAYELVFAKENSRLHPGAQRMRMSFGRDGRHLTGSVTLPQLADIVSRDLDRPVVDRTGVTGQIEVDLTWQPKSRAVSDEPQLPAVFTELNEKLGLKVQSGKVPVDIVVVDHVEKLPTPN